MNHSTTLPTVPTTPMQRAYFTGINPQLPLGGMECAGFLEFRGKVLDIHRLKSALQQIGKTAVLNCRFLNRDEITAMAVGCPEIAQYHIADADIDAHSAQIRQQFLHKSIDISAGSMWAVAISTTETQTLVHLAFSLAVIDFQGVALITRQLADLYNGETCDIMTDLVANHEAILADMTPPKAQTTEEAPLPAAPQLLSQNLIDTAPVIDRYTHCYTSTQWKQFERQAKHHYHATPAALFLAVYTQALRQYAENDAFIITLAGLYVKHSRHVPGMRTTAYLHRSYPASDFADLVRQTHEDLRTRIRNHIEAPDEIRTHVSRYGHAGISPYVLTYAANHRVFDATTTDTLGTPHCWGQTPQVVLDCQVLYLDDEHIEIGLDVRRGGLKAAVAKDILQAICTQIEALMAGTTAQTLLSPSTCAQRKAVNTQPPACLPTWLYTPFRQHCAQQPDAPAILLAHHSEQPNLLYQYYPQIRHATHGEISYAHLNTMALQVAAFLVRKKIPARAVVGICLPKGAAQIVAALGVLYSGCTYLPMNLHIPEARRQHICQVAEVAYVLSAEDFATICTIEALSEPRLPCTTTPIEQAAAESIAYIIYTSGSTGQPKGVAVSHYAALNTITAVNRQNDVTSADRILAVSALEFDLSVYDIFGLLSSGGAIVTLEEGEQKDAFRWGALVKQFHITLWNSVPALVEMLLIANDTLPSVRRYFCSGDWISYDLFTRLQPVSPNAALVAMGGATEAAIWSNSYLIRTPSDLDTPQRKVPYGIPLSGQQYRVVKVREYNGEQHYSDCADGVGGELWIGGVGLATGYYHDDTRTAQHFIHADSGATATAQRWYRTGDIGCWDNGLLYFIGRADNQVKINGYRIECGEVEQVLMQLPTVDKAVVVPIRQHSALGAVIIADSRVDIEALKTALARSLPNYMIPDQFICVEALTLTANGKVDRKWAQQLLAQRQANPTQTTTTETHSTQCLQHCRNAWAEVLGHTDIKDNDNFFALGGDSLSATRVCALLKKDKLTVGVETLFTYPILAEFARACQHDTTAPSAPQTTTAAENTAGPFPLTPLQRAYALGSDGIAGIIAQPTICSFILESAPEYTPQQWCDALNRLIAKSKALRLRRCAESQQYTDAAALTLNVLPTDCSLRQYLMSTHPEATQAPPMEIVIASDDELHIGLAVNYLCYDASALLAIVGALISEITTGTNALPDDIDAFYHYACHSETAPARHDALLAHYPPPQLPLKPAHTQYHLPQALTLICSSADRQHLEAVAKAQQVTLTALLLHAFGQALARSSGQALLTLCLPVAYRPEGASDALGNFTQLQLCRCSLTDSVREVNADLAQVVSGQAPGLGQIAASGRATYPVVFTSTLGTSAAQGLFNGRTRVIWAHTRTPGVLLDCQVSPSHNGGLEIRWDYLDGVMDAAFFAQLRARFIQQITALGITPQLWTPPYDHNARACISALLCRNLTPIAPLAPVVATWRAHYPAVEHSDPNLEDDITYLAQCVNGEREAITLWEHPRLAPEAVLHRVLSEESVYTHMCSYLKTHAAHTAKTSWRCAVLGSGCGIICTALAAHATQVDLSLQLYPIEPSAALAEKGQHLHGIAAIDVQHCPPVDIVFIPATLHRDSRIETQLTQLLQHNPNCLLFVVEITAISAATHLAALLDPTLVNSDTCRVQPASYWQHFLSTIGVAVEESREMATLIYCIGRATAPAATTIAPKASAVAISSSAAYPHIAALWQNVLTLDTPPSLQDDFFQLGGDSLKATQIVGELRSQGYAKLQLADLFNHSTLDAFLIHLDRQSTSPTVVADEPARPEDSRQRFALSPVQKAYLAGRSGEQILGGVASHCYFEYQADGDGIDTAKLEYALDALVQRHPILRAGIVYQDDEAWGQFAAVPAPRIERCTDVRAATAAEVPDPTRQSALVMRLSNDGRTLGIGMDNLMLDGQSMWHILHELDLAYSGQALPPPSGKNIPNLSPQQSAQDIQADKPSLPPAAPQLPYTQDPVAVTRPHFARCRADLDAESWSNLTQLARTARLTPSSLLTAAYAVALTEQLPPADFSLNLTTFMRPDGYQQSLGDFTVLRLLPISWQQAKNDELLSFAKHIQHTLVALQDGVADTIGLARAVVRETGNPLDGLFPVVLTCGLGLKDQQSANTFSFGTLTYACSQTPQVTLDLQVHDDAQGLHLTADYVAELLPQANVAQLLAAIVSVLRHLLPTETPPESVSERVATLWQTHLALAADSQPDNFFRDGGDSLRATRFIRDIQQQIHPQISLRTLIQHPNFADFVIAVEQTIAKATQQSDADDTEEGTL